MATLLKELLHDACRRAEEISAELTALKDKNFPSAVDAYRLRMLQTVERASQLITDMLADPDLEDPLYATSYFRDYKYVARLIQELENLPVLVLRRFTEQDQSATALMQAICTEVKFPFSAPICSSISSQYYWTVAGMDLVFVPCLEPDHLLGLPDGYHELGHILLYREEKRLVHPALAIVDRWYDRTIAGGRRQNWPEPSLEDVEQFRHRWRLSWLLEFGADLIATFLAGPSFGWCNIRTSTNLGGELFSGNETHPADDARARAIGLMLNQIACDAAAQAISGRWSELVKLSNESPPPRYELAYADDLLAELTAFFHAECCNLGMRQYDPAASNAESVTFAVNEAWQTFRDTPDTFGEFEKISLKALVSRCT